MKPRELSGEIAGQEWLIRFARLRGKAAGWCEYDKHKILVDTKLSGVPLLETIVHEVLHAEFPWLTEASVTESAADIAKILAAVGYSLEGEEDVA